MQIKRDKEILNFRETQREKKGILSGTYPHVVGDKIYWQLAEPTEIAYAVKNNGVYEKPTNNIAVNNSFASANFRAFIDTNPDCPEDERYKAVGGYHVGRGSVKNVKGFHNAQLHKQLLGCAISENAEIVEVLDHVWPEYTKLLFKDDFYHPRHANGIYVFKSSDGIKWTEYHNKPVLSVFTECEGGVNLGSDSFPSIFYDHNIDEYVLYIRCNIKLGVRHVLYTKSKDMITWDKPKLINKDPEFDMEHENLYYMGAFPLPNSEKYISFTPHFRNDILTKDGSKRKYYNTKTLVMISDNGVDWKVIDEILDKEYSTHLRQPHVVSFREENDEYALYVNENYFTNSGKLVRYTFNKNELDIGDTL